MMKNTVFLFLLFTITIIFADTSGIHANDAGFCNEPKRIISLAPSNTEILFALGLEARVVGVSCSCDYPETAKKKEKVGNYFSPDLERILLLKPDLVLCGGGGQKELVFKLNALKIPAIMLCPKDLEEVLGDILMIGKATGKEKEAFLFIKTLKDRMDKIKSMADKVKKPKVYLEIWNSPLTSAGKGSFIDELITIAGGENIFNDIDQSFSQVSAEEIIKRNPDIIITAYMRKKGEMNKAVTKRDGWSGIKAVKEGRVIDDIDSDLLLRPGPRLIDGLEALSKKFY